jgi:membrane fusion protein, multidrug efflux system
MKFGRWQTVAAVAAIAIALGVAWLVQNRQAGLAAAPAARDRSAGGATPSAGSPGGANPSAGGPGAGPVAVEVATATARSIEDAAQGVGSLRALRSVMLRPEISGRISRIGFADGATVRRGQLLVQLDDALPAAELRQAKAQAGIARTQHERNRELLAQNFISRSGFDQSAAALEVAQAQVALAQAQLERLRVLAPFNGVAGIRSVSEGDYVQNGSDLVGVEDHSTMRVDFRLPERYLAKLKPGLPVVVDVDAWPGRRFDAKVDALDSVVDADGRSVLVRARIDNKQAPLKSGMFARVRVVFDVRDDAVMVPEEALVPVAGRQFIVKVIDRADGTPASQRLEARVGVRTQGQAEITQGLKAGDRVVTAGHSRLLQADGLPLRVVEVAPAGAQPSSAPSASPPASGSRANGPSARAAGGAGSGTRLAFRWTLG